MNANTPGRPIRQELQDALDAASSLGEEALPWFIGDLEVIRSIAWARLVAPGATDPEADELLDIHEAARRLSVSPDFLYHSHRRFPFTRRLGRSLRFSARGIEMYIRGTSGRGQR